MDRKFIGAGALWEESCKIAETMLLEANIRLVFLNEQYERVRVLTKSCQLKTH
jgi:hypothetical protein